MNEQQTMTPLEGFNALAKDVLPKIIARVKELDSRLRDIQGDMQEDLTELRKQVQKLQELVDKPKPATRTRKKKKEPEAEPEQTTVPNPNDDVWAAMMARIKEMYASDMTPEEIAETLDAPLELVNQALEV